MTDADRAAPAAPADTAPAWWRSAVIYQVYPRSFADADGDGIGDLPGITARLGYLRALGVDAVWISPFTPSPQADGGYDVADYCGVDPLFGALDDADALLARAHELGLRVIIDLVPNHTSDEHPWFQRALAAGPGSPERDWYHFRDADPEDPSRPPNDWPSEFGGPAWSKEPAPRPSAPEGSAGQWYLHLFDAKQPDLNWEHPPVREAFERILRFWLDRGVDGFRVDVAHGLVKAPGLPDSGLTRDELANGTMPTSVAPYYDQEGVHDVYRAWRRILDEYPGDRVMVAEAWIRPYDRVARYVRPDEHHQAFNFPFLSTVWDADALRASIAASFRANEPVGAPTTWVLSNHDVIRHATRFALADRGATAQLGAPVAAPDPALGLRRARAATALMLALPGSAYLYQGEELGLPEVLDLDPEARRDPTFRRTGGARLGRDGCRVPIPWEGDAPAYGFSPSGASWLPQPPVFGELAVDRQEGAAGSTLELYRRLLALRRERGLGSGSLAWVEIDGADIEGAHDGIVAFDVTAVSGATRVVLNLGPAWTIPAGWRVLVASDPGAGEDPGSREDPAAALLPTDCAVWLAG
ncbi:glycoside hydrolase family 13 protein [Leucobacter weissii]|uniref:Glycoside hydrolase family 13 protein n=1 Tax=Leucobacter weissii TaxID=1983706 RepID=A0A939S9I3_9MICO|nr:glycoside hydrolase family 13 protein [Leucobacter weissii]